MIRALQLIFNAGDPGLARQVRDELGVEGARLEMRASSPDDAGRWTREIAAEGLWTLTTLEKADQVVHFAGLDIEYQNEPDLAGTRPEDYLRGLIVQANAAETAGVRRLYGGCISNLDRDSLRWLEATNPREWPEICGVSFHLYAHGDDPRMPHPGFRSVDDQYDELLRIIGPNRPHLCSEFGFTTAWRKCPRSASLAGALLDYLSGSTRRRWTDSQVADHIAYRWDWLDRTECEAGVLFQLNDGAPPEEKVDVRDHELHYGIRYMNPDGTPGSWKPAASTFRRVTT